jgi:PilZ domain
VSLFGKLFALLHPRGPRSSPRPPLTCGVITLKPSRREERGSRTFQVLLSNGEEPMLAELASTENVSSYGARVRTELAWRPNARIFLKSPKGKFWMRARVVYCRALQAKTHALGLEFYATAHRYTLAFRCIKCGRDAASANYRSDRVLTANQLQAQVYRVHCAACGWKGEAIGFSAIRALHYKSKETYGPDEGALRLAV